MPYTHLNWKALSDLHVREVFEHANMYLFDVYGMFRTLPPPDGDGGGGNFTIALTLLCVIDGLAREVWPGKNAVPDQEKRFKRLITDKLHWGPEGRDKWEHKGNAADQLYCEIRNPLTHELAGDKAAPSRPAGYVEPVIGKWGPVPEGLRDIEKIDALLTWDNAWPVLHRVTDDQGRSRFKLVLPALYWTTKRLAQDLLAQSRRP